MNETFFPLLEFHKIDANSELSKFRNKAERECSVPKQIQFDNVKQIAGICWEYIPWFHLIDLISSLCHITTPDRPLIQHYVKWILKEIAWQRAASHVFRIPIAKIQVPSCSIHYIQREKKNNALTKDFIHRKDG